MKKTILLTIIMTLLLFSFASADITTLDEANNVFISNIGGGSGLIRAINFEYFKPLGNISSADVQLKIGKTPTTNYTIPQSCLDRDVLSFQYRVDTATFTPALAQYYCLNTTNQLELITQRDNYTGDTNTPSVTTFGEEARAYDNDYNTGVLGYNFEFFLAPTTAISNSQRADSVFYEQDLILEHTGSLTLVCDGSFSQQPCYIPSGYTLNLDPGTHTINQTLYIDDGVTINGNGATLLTSVSAPIRINGSNTNINNLNINGSVNGAILIEDTASNGVINNVNCDVDLYCVRFLGGNNFDVTNINGEALVIQNANDIFVDNYVMNANIVSSVSSFAIYDSTNILIENSDFTGVDSFGDGFYIAGQTITSENITIRNNVFNDLSTIYATEFGGLTRNVLLENNIFNNQLIISSNTPNDDNIVFYNNFFNAGVTYSRPLCDSSLSYIPCNVNQNNLTLNNNVYDFGNYNLNNEPMITLEDNSFIDGNGATIIVDNYNETSFVAGGDVINAQGGGGITNLNINSSNAPVILGSLFPDRTFYLNNTELKLNGDIGFGLTLYVSNMRTLYINNNVFEGRTIFETDQFFYGSKITNNQFYAGFMQPGDDVIQFGLVGSPKVSSGLQFYNNFIESGVNYDLTTIDFFTDIEDDNNVLQFRGLNDKYVISSYYDTSSRTYEEIKESNGFTTGVYYGEGFGTPINFDIDIDTSEIRMTKNKVILYPGSNMDQAVLVFREINDYQTINGSFTDNYVLYKDAKPYFNQNACEVTQNNLSVECGVSGYGVYVITEKITNFDLSKLDYYWDFSSEYSNETAVFDRLQQEPFKLISGTNLVFVNSTRGEALDTTGLNFLTDDIGDYNNKNVTVGINARAESTNTLELLGVGSQPNLLVNPRTNLRSRINYWEFQSVGFLTARVTNNLFNWDNWITMSGQDNSRIEVYGYDFDQRNPASPSVIYDDYFVTGTVGNPFFIYDTATFGSQDSNYLALGFGFSNSGASLIDDYYISNTKLSEAEILYIQNNELAFNNFNVNISNISINTSIVEFNEDLLGICSVDYDGFDNITYNYTWKVNGLEVTDSFLSPNTPIYKTGVISSGETTTQYTYTALSDNFLYDPIVTAVKSQLTCGINYRLELGDQIYQRSFGVFHSNYNINPYASIGNFPFTINNTYIDNGEVTFNLTTQFACVTPGAFVQFSLESNPLNSNTLTSGLFSDGDNVTFECVANAGELSSNASTSELINVLSSTPQNFLVNPPLLENLTTNETIYNLFDSLTLNSTGRNLEFSYTQSFGDPTPNYNVWLSNGILSYEIRTNTSSNNFVENINKDDITIPGNYFVRVQAFNSEGDLVVDSAESVYLCSNNWVAQYTSCFNDTQLKTYIDANSCAEQYDFPLDNNTLVSCDDGIVSAEELEERNTLFKENLLVMLWLLIMGVALIFFYVMSRSTLSSILVTSYFFLVGVYLFIQFPNDWIIGVGSLIIGSAFGLSSWIMNKEV